MLQSMRNIIAISREMGYEDLTAVLEATEAKLKVHAIEGVSVGNTSALEKAVLSFVLRTKDDALSASCVYFRDEAKMYKLAYLLSKVLREGERRWYDKIIEANLEFNDITLKEPNLVTMIKHFNKLIKNPVIIYDEFFNVMAATDEKLCDYDESSQKPQRCEMRNLFYYKQRVYFKSLLGTKRDCNRLLYPVLPAGGGEWKGYLAIFDMETPYEEMDMMILEIFANSVLTEMRRQLELQDVERKFISDFVYDLIYRKEEKAEELLRRARSLHVAADAEYCMITVRNAGVEKAAGMLEDKEAARYEFMNDRILNHIDNFHQKYFDRIL